MQANDALTGENTTESSDLGPLAWVLDELRKSLDGATQALRRFVRDAELARGSDLAALDASQLRIARQQLHQAVGALEMVGMTAPAKMLRGMEALAQRFVQRPELCSDDAANKLERASFALTEYLEGVLKGKTASPVALFAQYREVLELNGDDRIHPADLWPHEWRWIDVALPEGGLAHAYDSEVRARIDGYVLNVVKTGDATAARALRDISLSFAAAQAVLEPRVFWKICAAYFEAVALGLCPADIYGKRAASRILLQYRTLARGEPDISERLVQDLLFFCAQAIPRHTGDAPVLEAVRAAYGLTRTQPFNYDKPQFGRFDPALLAQARKRMAAATETWSALAGGDTSRIKVATDQFGLVADSVLKLHPECGDLARALTQAIDSTARSNEAPTPALAMEVATAVLYLEAAYDDLDPTDSHMAQRSASLSRRLTHVNAGGQPEPLEAWMEELYRGVSDRQIMGSVVDELRTSLGEVEKSLDTFFRQPLDKLPLHEVPSKLAQMRGVFSVLGLEQAATAALRMRGSVEKFLVDDATLNLAQPQAFEKLGNSLGALGFLIDMLSYQRELAKKLFFYDEALGEFMPVMGREKPQPVQPDAPESTAEAAAPALEPLSGEAVPHEQALADTAGLASPVASAAAAPEAEDDDNLELKDIFLEEAREVVQTGLAAILELAGEPADLSQQTTLRRAFHTLKGSGRMVGLTEFGEAAWAMEQLLNSWLAEQKPASDALISLSGQAMHGLGRWVEDIAGNNDALWSALPFRQAADALRLQSRLVDLQLPGQVAASDVAEPQELEMPLADFAATEMYDFGADPELQAASRVAQVDATAFPDSAMPAPLLDVGEFDFGDFAESAPESLEPELDAWVSPDQATTTMSVLTAIPDTAPVTDDAWMDEPLDSQAARLEALDIEEQVKVIDGLRIDIPLYNVYLNEADEWSRRLLTELSEWSLELHKPLPDTAVALAHSLAGSSATVGFTALSGIARALEHALQHVQLHEQGQPAHAEVFVESAEDIRRLLHQFAAGFLKEPNPALVAALKAISALEFAPPESEEPDDAALDLAPAPAPEEDVAGDFNFDLSLEPEPEHEFDAEAEAEAEAESPQEPEAEAEAVSEFEPAVSVLPATEPAFAALVDEDAIDLLDVLDVDLFPIFEEEALELLPHLGGALRQWTARPDNLGARSEVLRVLHTLKGSARLSGAMRLGEMTHRMESAVERLGTDDVTSAQLEPLLAKFDTIQAHFEALRATPEQALSLPEASPVSAPEEAAPVPELDAAVKAAAPVSAQVSAALPVAPAPVRAVSAQTVRVRSQLLDRLVNQAGEVMMTRSRMEAHLGQLRGSLSDLTGNLDRLRHQLRDIEVQSESQMQSRLAQSKESAQGFDPLEFDRFTRVQELTRMMAESVDDVATVQRNLQRSVQGAEDDLIAQGRQARELQRDLLRTRMVEFDGIAERLYGVVRQAAKEAGKQVRLDMVGGSLDMDRGVLERMAPVFEHLLRNAVVHGIEDPALRVKAGKPPLGTITLTLQQQGNDVTVELRDDGAGLNLDRIRQKARASGQIGPDDSLTDAELANLIYTPGLSTSAQVTELAGRGIGLDVVRSEVSALGGRIETHTETGVGACFKLVLPLTTAVTQVVLLRMGDLVVGVPANLVELVKRVPGADVADSYERETFEFAGERVPFYWAGALLQTSVRSTEARGKTLPVAVFRSAGQRVALQVDEVLGNQEVVVKNLGPQLASLPGLAGMSVLASGAVILIYNPVALATVYGSQARQLKRDVDLATEAATAAGSAVPAALLASVTQGPLVLVVDDSITVRRVTQRLLKREGFRVALAADGLQALERLQEEKPAVVLSDIEMPRMDGFDLVRNIRADARLRDLPVVMITSRIAEKHRELARELGVDHYLGKPYSEDELIGLVRQYCAAQINV
jgi:chemosensory pili system protein ChpA (sensor histidine kinase/response regulator)